MVAWLFAIINPCVDLAAFVQICLKPVGNGRIEFRMSERKEKLDVSFEIERSPSSRVLHEQDPSVKAARETFCVKVFAHMRCLQQHRIFIEFPPMCTETRINSADEIQAN